MIHGPGSLAGPGVLAGHVGPGLARAGGGGPTIATFPWPRIVSRIFPYILGDIKALATNPSGRPWPRPRLPSLDSAVLALVRIGLPLGDPRAAAVGVAILEVCSQSGRVALQWDSPGATRPREVCWSLAALPSQYGMLAPTALAFAWRRTQVPEVPPPAEVLLFSAVAGWLLDGQWDKIGRLLGWVWVDRYVSVPKQPRGAVRSRSPSPEDGAA
jgi:hypothetical protein